MFYNTYRETKEQKKRGQFMKLLIGNALVHSLLPLHGRIRVCLGSGTLPYMEPHSLWWASCLVWRYLSLFQIWCVLCSASLRVVQHLANPLLYLFLVGSECSPLPASQNGCIEIISLNCLHGGSFWRKRPKLTIKADLSLSVLSCCSI